MRFWPVVEWSRWRQTQRNGPDRARLAALRISGLDRRISTFASIGSALAHLTPGLSARTGPLPPCDKGAVAALR